MDSSTVALRLKQTPRFRAIVTRQQLYARLETMTPLEIWVAMIEHQRSLSGWKHKIMSDELQGRKRKVLFNSGLFPYADEV